jgi:hypothetical protein
MQEMALSQNLITMMMIATKMTMMTLKMTKMNLIMMMIMTLPTVLKMTITLMHLYNLNAAVDTLPVLSSALHLHLHLSLPAHHLYLRSSQSGNGQILRLRMLICDDSSKTYKKRKSQPGYMQ